MSRGDPHPDFTPSRPPKIITIKGKPQGQGRGRAVAIPLKGGGTRMGIATPSKTRNEAATVKIAGGLAMGNNAEPWDYVALEVVIMAYMPMPASMSAKDRARAATGLLRPTAKPDASNIMKLLEDALNEVVWKDDALISDVSLHKRYSDNPRNVVAVREVALSRKKPKPAKPRTS